MGYIPIDSVHSPVRKVEFLGGSGSSGTDDGLRQADHRSVDQRSHFAGPIPSNRAAKLLKDHMTIFINFEELPETTEEPAERALSQMNEVLNRSVEELELSVRSYNCLKNANIQTIGDPVQKTEAEMLQDQKLRPQIAERNQRDSGRSGAFLRDAVRRAGPPVSPAGLPATLGGPVPVGEDEDDDIDDDTEIEPVDEEEGLWRE